MFISEETYNEFIETSRAKFKPWLPTQESLVENAINQIPGLVSLSIKDLPIATSGRVVCELLCTQAGLQHYIKIFKRLSASVANPNKVATSFFNETWKTTEADPPLTKDVSVTLLSFLIDYRDQENYVLHKYAYLDILHTVLNEVKEELDHVHL